MRVLLYTRPCFLDQVLSAAPCLSHLCELHIVLEISPESWSDNLLAGCTPVRKGESHDGRAFLRRHLGPAVAETLWEVAGIHLAIHEGVRSLAPCSLIDGVDQGLFMRRLRPDVVHLNDVTARVLPALPVLWPIPIVLSIHDLRWHPGQASWRGTVARRIGILAAREIITHNRAQTPAFALRHRIPPSRIHFVAFGAYSVFDALSSDVPRERRLVVFVGRLDEYKGLGVLASAARLVSEACPDVKFIVAGPPVRGYCPPRPDLPPGASYTVQARWLRNDELARLVASARVVVLPYTQATQSGVLMAAMALGTPTVSTAVGGLADYAKEGLTGIVVRPGDSRGTADAIIRMLEDDALHDQVSAGIREAKYTSYSWETPASQMMSVYESAVSQRR